MIKPLKTSPLKFICLFFCFLILGGAFSLPFKAAAGQTSEEKDYYAPDFNLQASAALVINNNTGFVVYQRQQNMQLPAASLAKMVTALVVRALVKDISTETVTAQTWVFNQLYGQEASHADIWNGESRTVQELLHALLIPSANEAALMLAAYVSGGYVANFVRMMNAKAAALGCTNTVFVDPSGMSEQNISTAKDMAIIVNAFLKDELLAKISTTAVYEMAAANHPAPYYIHNTNRLLVAEDLYAQPFSGIAGYIKGGKTGNLGSWQNFACVAVKNQVEYTVVVLQSPNEADEVGTANALPSRRPALYEAALLYKWAFGNFEIGPACNTSTPIYEIPVKYSTDATGVHLLPAQSLQAVLPKGISEDVIEKTYQLPPHLGAPVAKGQFAGYVVLSVQGKQLGRVQLLAAKAIGRNAVLFAIQKTGEFFQALFFKVLAVYLLLFGAAYVCLSLHFNKIKRQKAALRAARRRKNQNSPKQKNY